jgi:ribonuclease PH
VLREPIAAVSVGIVEGKPMLDLKYDEDSRAEVDLNVVGTASGKLVEVQGTAEGAPVHRQQIDALLDLALAAIPALVEEQKRALTAAGIEWERLFV